MQRFSSFLRRSPALARPSLDTKLVGERVILCVGDPDQWKAWRILRDMSRDYLVPWEPEWPENALAYSFYCGILRRQWREWRDGTGYAFTVFMQGTTAPILIGGITLSDVIYAASQKGTIGYWIGKPYAGQGLMTEAVGLICGFAYNTLQLRRIEASCLPHNDPSKAVLRRCGFEEEGYAKEYLQINGKREDHLLWGKALNR